MIRAILLRLLNLAARYRDERIVYHDDLLSRDPE